MKPGEIVALLFLAPVMLLYLAVTSALIVRIFRAMTN